MSYDLTQLASSRCMYLKIRLVHEYKINEAYNELSVNVHDHDFQQLSN